MSEKDGTCEECDSEPTIGTCYRWKNANIQILACKEHRFEIIEILNKAQAE